MPISQYVMPSGTFALPRLTLVSPSYPGSMHLLVSRKVDVLYIMLVHRSVNKPSNKQWQTAPGGNGFRPTININGRDPLVRNR